MLASDVIFVKKIPFFIVTSRNTHFSTIRDINNMSKKR